MAEAKKDEFLDNVEAAEAEAYADEMEEIDAEALEQLWIRSGCSTEKPQLLAALKLLGYG